MKKIISILLFVITLYSIYVDLSSGSLDSTNTTENSATTVTGQIQENKGLPFYLLSKR